MTIELSAPEIIKKKRLNFEKNWLQKEIIKRKLKKKKNIFNKLKVNRGNIYIKEYKSKISFEIEQNRISRSEGKFYIPFHAKVFFVIRIRGINDIPPQAKKILELIRLKQINNGIFLKVNSSTIQMLKKVEPYIAYGYPSLRNISRLLKKRGYCKVGKRGSWQRIFLSDDRIIRAALSTVGIFSIEDIIQELFKGGSRFKEVNNFLWPFKLKSPKKGYSSFGKKKHVTEGGAFGNWEDAINELIYRMN